MQILAITSIGDSPVKGGSPVRHSNSTQPSEKMSARASTSRSPRACSGAMYIGVPTVEPTLVKRLVSSTRRAMPKSSMRVSSSRQSTRKMLLGLMSRWTMPRSCAVASASSTRRPSRATRRRRQRTAHQPLLQVSPESHSIAMYDSPCEVMP